MPSKETVWLRDGALKPRVAKCGSLAVKRWGSKTGMATQFTVVSCERVHEREPAEIHECRRVDLPAGRWVVLPCDAQHQYTEGFYVSHGPGLNAEQEQIVTHDDWVRVRAGAEAFDPSGVTRPEFAFQQRGTAPGENDVCDYHIFLIEQPGVWGYSDRVYSNGEDDTCDIWIRSPVDAVLQFNHVLYCESDDVQPTSD